MKISQMKKDDLLDIATTFAVDVEDTTLNEMQIKARLTEDGISQKMVDELFIARERSAQAMTEKAELDAQMAKEDAATEVLRAQEVELAAREASRIANVITAKNIVDESATLLPGPTPEQIAEARVPVSVMEAARRAAARAPLDKVLLHMDRPNASYRVRGIIFTREHPFALASPVDAEFITEFEEGFRYATPKEARQYYS